MSSLPHLTLHFSNRADEAPRIARRIESFLNEHQVSESTVNKILLCVDELITNLIAHAYKDKDDHAVLLECRLDDRDIALELRDDGLPFDPTHKVHPNVQLGLEERDIGGLGIHFVMTLMDKVVYQREGDFNVLRITKAIE